MIRAFAVTCLLCALSQLASAGDRLADFEKLTAEFDAATKAFHEAPAPKEPTDAERIQMHEEWPGWRFIPQFVALAEAQPDDEVAFRSCQWIVDKCGAFGNWEQPIFEADQKVWAILATYHTSRPDLPMMCLRAVQYYSPARELFLRGLLAKNDLSRENQGFATVALAELLVNKYNYCENSLTQERPSTQDEYGQYYLKRVADFEKHLNVAEAPSIRLESIQLFRDVLARYADVPVTISTPYFRNLKTLGEKAGKSLHAIEHLTIGSEAPNIVGKDLQSRVIDLHDYRGRIVVVSFWFTGCGPCMGMVPQEQRLIEVYKGRPFALLAVCTDEKLEMAQKTAAEHNMDWPCWFDGQNGPIARDFNVLSWPTIYVLDKNGLIVAKNLRGDQLDKKVAELMDEKK